MQEELALYLASRGQIRPITDTGGQEGTSLLNCADQFETLEGEEALWLSSGEKF